MNKKEKKVYLERLHQWEINEINNLMKAYDEQTIIDVELIIKNKLDQILDLMKNYKEDIDNHFSYEFRINELNVLENILFYKLQLKTTRHMIKNLEEKEK